MDWFISVFGILGVFVVAVAFAVWLFLRRVNRILEAELARLEAILEQQIGLEIEVDNGLYYCYNSKDKQFVCQGYTAKEILEAFRSRYPTKGAYLAAESLDNPEIKQLVEEMLELKNETSSSQ